MKTNEQAIAKTIENFVADISEKLGFNEKTQAELCVKIRRIYDDIMEDQGKK